MLEVCVDSIESAINASDGGAGRLELCSALSEGGLTPTLGMLKTLKANCGIKIPIFVMIRPRRGDFFYSNYEIDSMIVDIEQCRQHGADGFVFGCLNESREIDVAANTKLMSACGGLPVTFHRAFDLTDPTKMIENCRLISSLGFKRILTSGFESSAEKGLENIRKLIVDQSDLIVMPGAGVSKSNLYEIISETGCKEFHASARTKKVEKLKSKISMGGGEKDLEPMLICDIDLVKELITIAKSVK